MGKVVKFPNFYQQSAVYKIRVAKPLKAVILYFPEKDMLRKQVTRRDILYLPAPPPKEERR